MMHKNGFIAAVRNHDGLVMREVRDTDNAPEVYLKTGKPYSFILKNEHDVDAVAEILVDGTNVLGYHKIVVPAKGRAVVGRFCADGNLEKGKELLFVEASDSRVQDPTSEDNGGVRIRFWKTRPAAQDTATLLADIAGQIDTRPIYGPFPEGMYKMRSVDTTTGEIPVGTANANWKYDPTTTTGFDGFEYESSTRGEPISYGGNERRGHARYSCSSIPTLNDQSAPNPYAKMMRFCDTGPAPKKVGATVEGQTSTQKFGSKMVGDLEDTFTEIRFRLVPAREVEMTVNATRSKYCTQCGAKCKFEAKFCGECGTKF